MSRGTAQEPLRKLSSPLQPADRKVTLLIRFADVPQDALEALLVLILHILGMLVEGSRVEI